MKYITDEMIDKVYEQMEKYSIYARNENVEEDVAQEVKSEIEDLIKKGVFSGVSISKGKITFSKERFNEYCIYKEMDMRLDKENVEDKTSPTLAELNFKHSVVGSDETGNGELFKNFIITAACVRNVDDLRRCIKLGITDSKNYMPTKKMKDTKTIEKIGESITGIKDWSELINNQKMIPSAENRVKENPDDYKLFVEGDFFVSRIITNEELNWRCERNENKIKNTLRDQKEEGHMDVLKRLYAKLPKEYQDSVIVIDNIIDISTNQNLEKERKELYKEELAKANEIAIGKEKIYMTPKGDSKVMAVGLASMISSYFCSLGMIYTKRKIAETCKISVEELPELPKASSETEGIKNVLNTMKNRCEEIYKNQEEYEELLNKYVKRYFDFKNPEIRELLGIQKKG